MSLLFLDFDLYEPTKAALEQFVPRMPRGAVLAFDELDNPIWPGETKALLAACRSIACKFSAWMGSIYRVRGTRLIAEPAQAIPHSA